MIHGCVTGLLIFLLCTDRGLAVPAETEPLHDDNTTVSFTKLTINEAYTIRKSIGPVTDMTIDIKNISSDVAFVLLQVHTYQYNVTISYDQSLLNKVSNRSLFGSNIGLYVKTDSNAAQVYLKNDNVEEVDALFVAVAYAKDAPIPGGCNLEFDIEIAPYQKLYLGNEMITVDSQPASAPSGSGSQLPCEKHAVTHEMYRLYLPEQDFSKDTYFSSIAQMLTVEDIVKNGHKIPLSITSPPMRRIFSKYSGVGSVYAIVATHGDRSSAYVPTFTYACSPLLYPDSCEMLNRTVPKLLCGIIFFLGLFSVFLGHRCIKFDMTLPVSVCGGIVGYTAALAASYDPTTCTLIGLVAAVIAVIMFLMMWGCALRAPFLGLFSNLMLGFLVASIMYYNFTDEFLQNDWVFWLVFTAVILLVSLVMSICTVYFGNAITCAIFGSYMTILPIDYYAGSSLKYIIINIIRRSAIPGFNAAIIYPPFQSKDIMFVVLWVILALIRVVKQYCGHVFWCKYCKSSESTPLLG